MSETENTPDLVSEAFDEYVEAFRAGRGDAKPFLSRFEGTEQKELDLLIEAFIATAPVSAPDPSDPRVAAIVNRVVDGLEEPAVGLAPMLATLRQKAKMTQRAVVDAIAQSIKASPAEAEKIDVYYHRLEWGSLPADGLSDRLLGMLARILNVEPDMLRRVAGNPGTMADSSGGVFARAADENDLGLEIPVASSKPEMPIRMSDEQNDSTPDRIDDLFTGG